MKALVTSKTGPSPVMTSEEREIPRRQPGFSLVRLHGATINQLSNTIRTGGYGETPVPLVQGNEASGIIEESDSFAKGTRVAIYGSGQLGITEEGLYQQWASVENRRIVALPDTLSLDEGAAFTVNYLTAYQALTRIGHIQAGQYVLISGASGSVGHALVQVARVLGAKPIALVSSESKAQHVLKVGAYAAINWTLQDAGEEIRKLTGGAGADSAFDPVGGPLFLVLYNAVRPRGRVVSVGFTAGKEVSLNLLDLIVNEKVIEGYAVHNDTPAQDREGLDKLVQLAGTGLLKPFIDSVYSFEDVEKGYDRLMSRQATGSIILSLAQ
ncbi:quinone oxidoreductase family protein [Candidatus Pantoea bituminis]|uniref:quinone oxidoreductase family protein n=1 Tax=Candidatus Pantoea bituminis TaxID=2831036 RepID=UPI001C05EF36|nr:zinc-binding alcohol dehydrogenase family protein [Pantoea bituminis]